MGRANGPSGNELRKNEQDSEIQLYERDNREGKFSIFFSIRLAKTCT